MSLTLWQDDCPYFHCTHPGWWKASLLLREVLTNGTGLQKGVAGSQADPVHWPACIWDLGCKNKQKWTVSPDVREREQRLKLGMPLTRLIQQLDRILLPRFSYGGESLSWDPSITWTTLSTKNGQKSKWPSSLPRINTSAFPWAILRVWSLIIATEISLELSSLLN